MAAIGEDTFPLAPTKALRFVAVLKEAGYRSGYLYLTEAEQTYARLGHPLGQPLRLAMTGAPRPGAWHRPFNTLSRYYPRVARQAAQR